MNGESIEGKAKGLEVDSSTERSQRFEEYRNLPKHSWEYYGDYPLLNQYVFVSDLERLLREVKPYKNEVPRNKVTEEAITNIINICAQACRQIGLQEDEIAELQSSQYHLFYQDDYDKQLEQRDRGSLGLAYKFGVKLLVQNTIAGGVSVGVHETLHLMEHQDIDVEVLEEGLSENALKLLEKLKEAESPELDAAEIETLNKEITKRIWVTTRGNLDGLFRGLREACIEDFAQIIVRNNLDRLGITLSEWEEYKQKFNHNYGWYVDAIYLLNEIIRDIAKAEGKGFSEVKREFFRKTISRGFDREDFRRLRRVYGKGALELLAGWRSQYVEFESSYQIPTSDEAKELNAQEITKLRRKALAAEGPDRFSDQAQERYVFRFLKSDNLMEKAKILKSFKRPKYHSKAA
jgi:hypothetical protein